MSGVTHTNTIKKLAVAGALALGVNTAFANDNAGSPMTAGLVMEKMPAGERFSYVAGIVEGFAHARFLYETREQGRKTQAGMNCIYNWFYGTGGQTYVRVEAAFRKYPEHYPATLIAAMLKKRCGE